VGGVATVKEPIMIAELEELGSCDEADSDCDRELTVDD
jgi:hypothetical protein